MTKKIGADDVRRAFTPTEPLRDAIRDSFIDVGTPTDAKEWELRSPVWAALARRLTKMPEGQQSAIRWSETQDSNDQTTPTLLLDIDGAVDFALQATINAAKKVLDVDAETKSANISLALGCVSQLREQLDHWAALRKLCLNEVSYEAWTQIHRAALSMHGHIRQMEGALTDVQRNEYKPTIGEPLTTVAGWLMAKLLITGALTPDLAFHVTQCAQDMRRDFEVFAAQRRDKLWKDLLRHCDNPFNFYGLSAGTATGLMPRPFIWAVLPGEEKKSGAEKYRAGVHYKRHLEHNLILKVQEDYGALAQALHVYAPVELLAEHEDAPMSAAQRRWHHLQRSLRHLRMVFHDAARAVVLMYTHVETMQLTDGTGTQQDTAQIENDLSPSQSSQPSPPSTSIQNFDADIDLQYEASQERLWMNTDRTLYIKGDVTQVKIRLDALNLEDDGLFDSQKFCLACYRSATSRNYCHIHAGSDPRAKREVRSLTRQFHYFTQILAAHRKDRFKTWKENFKNPGHRSSISQPVSWADTLYASYRFGSTSIPASTIEEALHQAQTALVSLQILVQPLLNTLSPEDAVHGCLKRVERILEPNAERINHQNTVRWMRTTRSLIQMAALSQDVMKLAEYLVLSPKVALQFRVEPSRGSAELELFTRSYVLDLLQALAPEDSQSTSLQHVPDTLYRHFFGVWFFGGTWGHGQGGDSPQRDGNSNIVAEFSPVLVAQQIERWAVWQASTSGGVPRQKHGKVNMDEVQRLRESGMSLPKIAAQIGISYDALRMATLRKDRKQAVNLK
jgi:hypothetical protein